jgi:uncharacterized protein YcgI (DUF1989 family)
MRSSPRAPAGAARPEARRGAAPGRPRGKQAVDFLCYNARDHEDRYAAARHDEDQRQHLHPQGHVIYSVNCNPMFTWWRIPADSTTPSAAAAPRRLNRRRYGKPDDPNCRQNFLDQLDALRHGAARHGGEPELLHARAGRRRRLHGHGPSISKPGDYVDLRAEMDVLAVVSNCPQINNPVNDYNPTPVRAIVYQPEA